MSISNKKKYICITKVGNNSDGTANCVKYRCSDLVSYCRFLDTKFPLWTWTNVFDNLTETKVNNELGRFTKNNRPTTKTPY
jgi:hypothetical protein